MLLSLAFYSRLPFVSVPVCAAIMLLFMCSASPIIIQVDNGVKHNVLRSLYSPYKHNPPLLTAVMSTETGTNSETENSGNYGEGLSITGRQANPPQFSYAQNSPGHKLSGTGIIRAQRGHGAGGIWPTSSTSISHTKYGGQSFERPLISKKSSQTDIGSSFYQRLLQSWPPNNFQNPYSKEKDPIFYSGDETRWDASDSSFLSSQSGSYWNTLLPTSRGRYSGYEETNEHAAGGIHSSEFLGFASQTAPHAPLISEGLDASVVESNPSPENPSITDFSQGLSSVSSGETQTPKKGQSSLFKNSLTSFDGRETIKGINSDGARISSTVPQEQRPSAAQGYSGIYSKQSQGEVQHLSNNVRPLYHNTNVVLYGPQTHSFIKYPPAPTTHSTAQTPTQRLSHPASGKTLESFAPTPHTDFQHSYTSSSEKAIVERPDNNVTGGSVYDYKPGRSTKILYGFRGFESPSRAVKKPSNISSNRHNSRRYSFDKGQNYMGKIDFKIANVNVPLSRKYSFGLREASTPKPIDSSSLTPGILHITQTTTVSTPGLSTSHFKKVRSDHNAGRDSNRNHRHFRISKEIYGLKGFGSRPLERAEALVKELHKSATLQQDFEGSELGSSQIWQLKSSRNHRWHNQTGETVQGDSNVSPQSLNALKSDAGSVESVKPSRFSPDKYKKSHKTYAFLGFQPVRHRAGSVQTHWKNTKQHPTTEALTHKVFSSYPGSPGGVPLESSPKSEPTVPSESKPGAMKAKLLSKFTSNTARGRRVRGKHRKKFHKFTSLHNDTVNVRIVRLPKCPDGVKAVTYTDILGGASFSSVRATMQAPTTPSDKGNFPNATGTVQQKENEQESRESTSRSPEAEAEDFSSVEDEKQSGTREAADSEMKTFDAFFDLEGSGSMGFNLSDDVFTDSTKERALGEDLLEQDYLQKSTGNISFKSVNLSQLDKR